MNPTPIPTIRTEQIANTIFFGVSIFFATRERMFYQNAHTIYVKLMII
jgi:hypothetical protein